MTWEARRKHGVRHEYLNPVALVCYEDCNLNAENFLNCHSSYRPWCNYAELDLAENNLHPVRLHAPALKKLERSPDMVQMTPCSASLGGQNLEDVSAHRRQQLPKDLRSIKLTCPQDQ